MKKNNYDLNSQGLSVEVSIVRDTLQAQYEYDENFKQIEDGLLLYIDYSNLSGDYDLSNDIVIANNKFNEVMLKKLLVKNDYVYYSEIKDFFFDDLVNDLFNFCANDKDEIISLLSDYNIEYTSNYTTVITRGYSQGNYAEILVNVAEFKKMAGVVFDEDLYENIFHNYLWDTPIYGTVTINGDEFIINEFINDLYTSDEDIKKEIIDYLLKTIKNVDLEKLEMILNDLIPDSIDYS